MAEAAAWKLGDAWPSLVPVESTPVLDLSKGREDDSGVRGVAKKEDRRRGGSKERAEWEMRRVEKKRSNNQVTAVRGEVKS